MFLVKTCCGCIPLQSGVITIGVLSLISAILNAVWIGLHVSTVPEPPEGEMNGLIFGLKAFMVSLLIYAIIGGIFAGLMIAGATKKTASYVFPWLALAFGGIIGAVCIAIAVTALSAIEMPIGTFFAIMLFATASTALQIYFWMVVHSYYKELVAAKYGHQTNPKDGKILSSPQLPPYHNV